MRSVAMPAIVRSSSLMKIRGVPMRPTLMEFREEITREYIRQNLFAHCNDKTDLMLLIERLKGARRIVR
jgi:hypothetical protein